jgi:hypothetical protein
MNKRGAAYLRGTMAERVAATRRTPSAPSAGPPPSALPPSPLDRLKHCWVSDEHGRLPGLLLEWRKVVAGWQGRVVHPVPEPGTEGWILVEEWLPAERLEALAPGRPAGGI